MQWIVTGSTYFFHFVEIFYSHTEEFSAIVHDSKMKLKRENKKQNMKQQLEQKNERLEEKKNEQQPIIKFEFARICWLFSIVFFFSSCFLREMISSFFRFYVRHSILVLC